MKYKVIDIKMKLERVHKEIEEALSPFDPIGFYVLIPTVLILLYLFT